MHFNLTERFIFLLPASFFLLMAKDKNLPYLPILQRQKEERNLFAINLSNIEKREVFGCVWSHNKSRNKCPC